LSTVEGVTAPPAPEPDQTATRVRATTRARRVRAASLLAPTSPALVYAGVVLIVAGFAVLAFTWSRVAGTAIVALQLPFVVSGGFTGLGLVVVGVLLMYLGVKRRDAWQRERRLEALAAALEGRSTRLDPASETDDDASE
jgi:membrane protein implicated in regulation of membrane protease activity